MGKTMSALVWGELCFILDPQGHVQGSLDSHGRAGYPWRKRKRQSNQTAWSSNGAAGSRAPCFPSPPSVAHKAERDGLGRYLRTYRIYPKSIKQIPPHADHHHHHHHPCSRCFAWATVGRFFLGPSVAGSRTRHGGWTNKAWRLPTHPPAPPLHAQRRSKKQTKAEDSTQLGHDVYTARVQVCVNTQGKPWRVNGQLDRLVQIQCRRMRFPTRQRPRHMVESGKDAPCRALYALFIARRLKSVNSTRKIEERSLRCGAVVVLCSHNFASRYRPDLGMIFVRDLPEAFLEDARTNLLESHDSLHPNMPPVLPVPDAKGTGRCPEETTPPLFIRLIFPAATDAAIRQTSIDAASFAPRAARWAPALPHVPILGPSSFPGLHGRNIPGNSCNLGRIATVLRPDGRCCALLCRPAARAFYERGFDRDLTHVVASPVPSFVRPLLCRQRNHRGQRQAAPLAKCIGVYLLVPLTAGNRLCSRVAWTDRCISSPYFVRNNKRSAQPDGGIAAEYQDASLGDSDTRITTSMHGESQPQIALGESQNRWKKRSSTKQRSLLLRVWPDMPEPHRPDFANFLDRKAPRPLEVREDLVIDETILSSLTLVYFWKPILETRQNEPKQKQMILDQWDKKAYGMIVPVILVFLVTCCKELLHDVHEECSLTDERYPVQPELAVLIGDSETRNIFSESVELDHYLSAAAGAPQLRKNGAHAVINVRSSRQLLYRY
ncbi:hypothetical protein PMIN01_08667 [Paraphaeosphaeria minitans]|uniref:Uncharacterized protein n=1 Tax=Paraphaeosphaeria minitans TaxID=565426 RepID=A0A9P6KNI0_9PLEO|nr:hypothetical protein PMIN01_08667 [Paraphaeosphaeria minitans]